MLEWGLVLVLVVAAALLVSLSGWPSWLVGPCDRVFGTAIVVAFALFWLAAGVCRRPRRKRRPG